MVLKLLHSTAFLRKMYFQKWGKAWVSRKVRPFVHHLNERDTILDIGSGNGLVAYTLRESGYQVTPLDVADLSYAEVVKPIVYDGQQMPFEDKTFDVALLLTVLHHIEEPDKVLQEACRVADRVIIIEDIYNHFFQKKMTFLMDSFINWGYADCPHTNKNDEEWKATFDRMNMNLKAVTYRRVLLFFKQGVYCIEHR